MIDYTEFGSLIKTLRLKREWTQRELGVRVDCTDVHISNVERNRDRPSNELFLNLCKTFEVDPIEILILCLDHPTLKLIQKKIRKRLDV